MPVVDALASEFADQVTFLAIAGRASLDATTPRAAQLLPSGHVLWSLDESVWETYGVFGQPVTFLISADDVLLDQTFGFRGEAEIRANVDRLLGTLG